MLFSRHLIFRQTLLTKGLTSNTERYYLLYKYNDYHSERNVAFGIHYLLLKVFNSPIDDRVETTETVVKLKFHAHSIQL